MQPENEDTKGRRKKKKQKRGQTRLARALGVYMFMQGSRVQLSGNVLTAGDGLSSILLFCRYDNVQTKCGLAL